MLPRDTNYRVHVARRGNIAKIPVTSAGYIIQRVCLNQLTRPRGGESALPHTRVDLRNLCQIITVELFQSLIC